MQKTRIEVPVGIRFISDWTDFILPNYPHIMNKVVTGCGFTEYFLRPNPKYPKVILVSPRRVLLENKEEQHNRPKDGVDIGPVYYARNDLEVVQSFDIDMTKIKPVLPKEQVVDKNEEYKRRIADYKQRLRNYIESCWLDQKEIRIMVTYDSFRLVREVLGEAILEYQIVVDEFQSIFTDSRFKSSTDLELLGQLQDLQNVCFLSATPMLDEYLDQLKDFKDLPYLELDWETLQPGRVHRPNLDSRQCTSIITAAREEIQTYLEGKFERYSYRDEEGNIQEIYSKELVIYCNSVKNICDILRKCNLTPDQVNILCAKTDENRKKINQAFKAIDETIPTRGKSYIGTVPQKGESHKMFTFCTRTVYLGADFYSTNARSLVLSDANIDCLAVDISLDLPQILGRQRLEENPWSNSAMFRFRVNTEKITEEEFREFIDNKITATNNLLEVYESAADHTKGSLANKYLKDTKVSKYRDDFVAINQHGGSTMIPVFNELVLVAEQRAFDIQKIDYKDRFSVLSEVSDKLGIDARSEEINTFLQTFESFGLGRDKMQFLCEYLRDKSGDIVEEILMNVPLKYKNYYTVLGPSRCYAFNYRMNLLEKEYQKQLQNQGVSKLDLRKLIYDTFHEGEKYLNSELKEVVQKIYDSVGLKKTGKASDFEEWFELKKCLIQNPETKKRENGQVFLKKK